MFLFARPSLNTLVMRRIPKGRWLRLFVLQNLEIGFIDINIDVVSITGGTVLLLLLHSVPSPFLN